MSILASFTACLTVKNIIFCIVVGIVVGIVGGFIKDEMTKKSHSLIALMIIGIVFAYIGIVLVANKYTLFSVRAILAGIGGAVIGVLIVGSAVPGRG